jgi:hypothetical protein
VDLDLEKFWGSRYRCRSCGIGNCRLSGLFGV